MADVEFFWDPVCPWAWITSQWVREVQKQRDLDVDWRFICLRLLNEGKIDYASNERYEKGHGLGLRLLRVANATREAGHRDRLGELYERFGTRIHVDRERDDLFEEAGVAAILTEMGLDPALAAAADDASHDATLEAEKEEALSRTGPDVGTPIITFRAGEGGPSFFGPVISRIPRGDDAVRLWDAVTQLAEWPGFAELKRSVRERPEVA
jgi:2-hydroxychromene-2-carboxylate isomerase